MSHSLTSLVCACLVVSQSVLGVAPEAPKPSLSSATQPSTLISVPEGTPVLIRLGQALASNSAHVDDPVVFYVVEDVTTNTGAVVISKGAEARGRVRDALAARRIGRRGKLDLEVDSVQSITGERIAVRADRKAEGKGSTGNMAAALATTAVVVGAPIASLWLLKHGHNTEIPVGTAFVVYTIGDVKVDTAKAQPPSSTSPLLWYQSAFLHGDADGMDKQVKAAADKPGMADVLLAARSDTEAYRGRLTEAREFTRRAVECALHENDKEHAALWQANGALHEAELKSPEQAQQQAAAALAVSPSKDVKILAALALARAGQPKRADTLIARLAEKFPSDATLDDYWLPVVRAASQLSREKPAKAIELLQAAGPYEMDSPQPMEVAPFYPAYLRGEALLALGKGAAAAAEFEKITSHPGAIVYFPLGALAHLELARAYALQGDRDKARAAYLHFLQLWEAADPDLAVFKQAKTEYSKYLTN